MRKTLFFVLAALLVLSCEKDPVIDVEGSASVEVGAAAASSTVKFTTNKAWTATSSESWLKVSPASGEAGNVTLTLSAAENTGYDARTATVTIKAGDLTKSVSVSQGQKDGLIITALDHEVEAEGGVVTIPVQANVNYIVTVDDEAKDWIKVTKTKALADYAIELSISANEKFEAREGSVTVAGAGETIPVTISQAARVKKAVETSTGLYNSYHYNEDDDPILTVMNPCKIVKYDDGTYSIKDFWGEEGYNLDFSVNENGTLSVLNAYHEEEIEEGFTYKYVATGNSNVNYIALVDNTLMFSDVWIDDPEMGSGFIFYWAYGDDEKDVYGTDIFVWNEPLPQGCEYISYGWTADAGEGYETMPFFPEGQVARIEVYKDRSIIVREWAGAEGYDLKVTFDEGQNVTSVTPIINEEEGETVTSGYVTIRSGIEGSWSYLQAYVAPEYCYADSEDGNGYVLLCGYNQAGEFCYYYIWWGDYDE